MPEVEAQSGAPGQENRAACFRHTLYASGNFAKNILWGTTEITLLFMMTEMLGIRPALAGAIILGSLFFDALLTPAVGIACDRLHAPRFGRYGIFILPGAPLAGLTFALLYALPWLGLTGPLAAGALLLGFRAAYALIDLPHNALLTTVTEHSPQRAGLSLLRFLFSSLAALLLAFSIGPLSAGAVQTAFSPERLAIYGSVVGLAAALVMIASWTAVAKEDRADARPASPPHSWLASWRACWNCPSYKVALAAGAAAALTIPLFSKSLLYLAGPVWERPALASSMLIAMIGGQIGGILIWTRVCRHRSTRWALCAAHCVVATGCLTILSAGSSNPWGLHGGAMMIGIGAAGVFALIWNLVADSCKAILGRSGIPVDGTAFSIAIVSQKAAIGMGAAAFGIALDATGYRAGLPVTASTRFAIEAAGFIIPALGSILIALMLCIAARSRGPDTASR
ncbi:MAG TPA: MFS transporter [Sphingomonadaceae bacterium]|nr:MFS transporter [Sphingomonadaceae bacterium]